MPSSKSMKKAGKKAGLKQRFLKFIAGSDSEGSLSDYETDPNLGMQQQEDEDPHAIAAQMLANPEQKRELLEFAEYLGMDANVHRTLLWIAVEAMTAPLPKNWQEYTTDDGNVYYYNVRTKRSQWEHPMDEYHRQLFHKEREAAGLPEGNAPQKSARGKEGALDTAGAGEGRARKGSASKGAPKMAEEGEFGQVKKKGKSGKKSKSKKKHMHSGIGGGDVDPLSQVMRPSEAEREAAEQERMREEARAKARAEAEAVRAKARADARRQAQEAEAKRQNDNEQLSSKLAELQQRLKKGKGDDDPGTNEMKQMEEEKMAKMRAFIAKSKAKKQGNSQPSATSTAASGARLGPLKLGGPTDGGILASPPQHGGPSKHTRQHIAKSAGDGGPLLPPL